MRRLSMLFGAAPELQDLAMRTREVQALQRLWESTAPPPLNRLSHVGLLRHGRLTVYASSGAIAAKLKMQPDRLIKKLQMQGAEVTSIHVKVQVTAPPRVMTTPRRRISERTARHLAEFARTLPDSPLRKALQQLARRR
ncbi:MAG: DUF721 domain-containing protein [Methylophilaceae bacterium]|nr:DUF721 domain-containing protein [Methylophilaceae bacterium]